MAFVMCDWQCATALLMHATYLDAQSKRRLTILWVYLGTAGNLNGSLVTAVFVCCSRVCWALWDTCR